MLRATYFKKKSPVVGKKPRFFLVFRFAHVVYNVITTMGGARKVRRPSSRTLALKMGSCRIDFLELEKGGGLACDGKAVYRSFWRKNTTTV